MDRLISGVLYGTKCTRPVEETGLVIRSKGALFPPDTHWKLLVGMWNEGYAHPRFFFPPLYNISHSTDQSKVLSVPFSLPIFPISPRPCFITLILICSSVPAASLYPPSKLMVECPSQPPATLPLSHLLPFSASSNYSFSRFPTSHFLTQSIFPSRLILKRTQL